MYLNPFICKGLARAVNYANTANVGIHIACIMGVLMLFENRIREKNGGRENGQQENDQAVSVD